MSSNSITKKWLVILCSAVFFVSTALLSKAADKQQDVKAELETRIKAWGNYLRGNLFLSDLTGNKYYRDIIDLGTPAVPYMVEKIEKGNWVLSDAVSEITRKRFEEDERPADYRGGSQDYAKLITQWWPKARKETPQRFTKLYSEWKDLKNQGKQDEAREKSLQIDGLGIAALQMIFEKIELGDTDLIPIVAKLTKEKVKNNAAVTECLAWWQQNKEQWLIPFPNKKPKANAGRDRSVTSGDTIQLDGSASTDADKDILIYRWKQIAGPAVNLSDAQAAQPGFTSPEVEKETVLVFELVVNDGSPKKSVHPSCESGESDPNTVNITVRPK